MEWRPGTVQRPGKNAPPNKRAMKVTGASLAAAQVKKTPLCVPICWVTVTFILPCARIDASRAKNSSLKKAPARALPPSVSRLALPPKRCSGPSHPCSARTVHCAPEGCHPQKKINVLRNTASSGPQIPYHHVARHLFPFPWNSSCCVFSSSLPCIKPLSWASSAPAYFPFLP